VKAPAEVEPEAGAASKPASKSIASRKGARKP